MSFNISMQRTGVIFFVAIIFIIATASCSPSPATPNVEVDNQIEPGQKTAASNDRQEPARQSPSNEIVLVADPWPPFNMEPGGNREGYMVDIAREVFGNAGYTVVYQTIPWKRAIEGTRTGIYTGAIGASKTDAEGFIFPDEELAQNYLSFYVRKDNPWVFENPTSIEQTTLGVIAGYDYRQWLNDYIQNHQDSPEKVQIVTGDSPLVQNLEKLINKRIDVVVGNEAVIRHTAEQMGILAEIKAGGYGQEPSFIYIAFSPTLEESNQLAGILSDGIVELRKSGRLKEILGRYNLKDWKKVSSQ